jgi:hypothetical protein
MPETSSSNEMSALEATEYREILRKYDSALTGLSECLNKLVNRHQPARIEVAKAELESAVARFKFVAAEAIWGSAYVSFNEELHVIASIARKYGINSDVEQQEIYDRFSVATYHAGYLTGLVREAARISQLVGK